MVEAIGGRPAVIVTHDLTEAAVMGTDLGVIEQGRLRQVGPVAEVLARRSGEPRFGPPGGPV